MTTIRALSALPAPSGGAVRLTVHTSAEDTYAVILASSSPTPPDPLLEEHARRVHGGKLPYRLGRPELAGIPNSFMLIDLDSDALPDGETVYYHAFELFADGTHGPALTVHAVPNCARSAAVTIARDILKKRLRYHLARAVRDQVIADVYDVPVLEQEIRVEGQTLPAVYVKERVTPNPSADTVGNQAGAYSDAHHPNGVKEYRFEFRASVDMLILSAYPSERTTLEAYLRGALLADRELLMAAGLEAPSFSSFTRHDVDERGGNETFGAELSVESGITVRVTEALSTAPAVTARAP